MKKGLFQDINGLWWLIRGLIRPLFRGGNIVALGWCGCCLHWLFTCLAKSASDDVMGVALMRAAWKGLLGQACWVGVITICKTNINFGPMILSLVGETAFPMF